MSRRAWILFAVASVLWGVPYLFAKLALADFSAVFTVFGRAALGAAVLLPIAWRRGALAPLLSDDARALAGGLLVLGGALSYAGATLYYKRHLAELPAVGVVAAALGACALIMLIPAALSAPASPPAALSVVSVAVLGSARPRAASSAFYSLIGLIGAGRASLITYVAPAVSVGVGVAFLRESVSGASAAGLLRILAGSRLSTGGRPPAPPRVAGLSPLPRAG